MKRILEKLELESDTDSVFNTNINPIPEVE